MYESDTELILTNLFYMLLLIILVIVVSFVLTKKTSDNIINTFNNISTHLKTINEGEYIPEPSLKEKITMLRRHLDMQIAFRGEDVGIKFFRKFYALGFSAG